MVNYDICVIGAGASGTLSSILLAEKGYKVCLLDKFEKPAKKLLVTGNGRCNITNKDMFSTFYNQNIDSFLNKFDYHDTVKLFKKIGLEIYFDEEGRAYPISNSAKTVQHVLINQIQKLNIDFFGEIEVQDVCFDNDKYLIKTDKFEIVANNVIFACGINEFSLSVLKKFDIKCNQVMPSLVALKTKQNTKKLDGIRVSNVIVKAKVGSQEKSEVGEILFKEQGLSGICIFNLSSLFAKNKHFEGEISINLLKNYTFSQIIDLLNKKVHIFKNAQSLLESMFASQLSKEILNRANIDFERSSKNLSKQDLEKIVDVIANFEFDVVGCYDNNQVLSGGVDLDALTKNLESKNQKGMYFCGELCDVDGVCGGYNLQWAWMSAFVVANDIIEKGQTKLKNINLF